MHWNHRVVDCSHDNGGEPWLTICEVYYNEREQPYAYCDPCTGGESIEELQTQVDRWARALEHPILNALTDFNNPMEVDDETTK